MQSWAWYLSEQCWVNAKRLDTSVMQCCMGCISHSVVSCTMGIVWNPSIIPICTFRIDCPGALNHFYLFFYITVSIILHLFLQYILPRYRWSTPYNSHWDWLDWPHIRRSTGRWIQIAVLYAFVGCKFWGTSVSPFLRIAYSSPPYSLSQVIAMGNTSSQPEPFPEIPENFGDIS